MILIGQYDSPFVRRVAIAMRLYGFEYEHRAWSVFRDAEKIADYNPLRRVPVLVLDDGEVLVETMCILEALDEMVGHERAMLPHSGPQRRRAMKVCALAGGLTDKAVSLVYEQLVHKRATQSWVARCEAQIRGTLNLLEEDRAGHHAAWWMGDDIAHADLAVAAGLKFLSEVPGNTIQISGWPALARHSETCEAMDVFRDTYQAFHAPGAED